MKKIIALVSILALSILLVIFLFSLVRKESPIPIDGAPTATPTQAPTTIPTVSPNQLVVVNTLPVPFSGEPYLPFQKITLDFNDAITPDKLFLEITPRVEIDIIQGQSSSTLLIIPRTTWALGETNIIILQTTSSTSGKRLISSFNHSITTALPTLSPEELESVHP